MALESLECPSRRVGVPPPLEADRSATSTHPVGPGEKPHVGVSVDPGEQFPVEPLEHDDILLVVRAHLAPCLTLTGKHSSVVKYMAHLPVLALTGAANLQRLLGQMTAISGLECQATGLQGCETDICRFLAIADGWRKIAEQFAKNDGAFQQLLGAKGKGGVDR